MHLEFVFTVPMQTMSHECMWLNSSVLFSFRKQFLTVFNNHVVTNVQFRDMGLVSTEVSYLFHVSEIELPVTAGEACVAYIS